MLNIVSRPYCFELTFYITWNINLILYQELYQNIDEKFRKKLIFCSVCIGNGFTSKYSYFSTFSARICMSSMSLVFLKTTQNRNCNLPLNYLENHLRRTKRWGLILDRNKDFYLIVLILKFSEINFIFTHYPNYIM